MQGPTPLINANLTSTGSVLVPTTIISSGFERKINEQEQPSSNKVLLASNKNRMSSENAECVMPLL